MVIGMRDEIRLEGVQAVTKLIDLFVAEMTANSEEHPSTRCISLVSLSQVLRKLRDQLPIALNSLSAEKLAGLLEQAGIIQVVPITPLAPGLRPDRFYILVTSGSGAGLESAELLQAHVPDGVICYFSAVQIHELSTQPAPHHHVAKIRPTPPSSPPGIWNVSDDRPPSLGSAQFSYEGVTYFLTHREDKLLQSTQRRYLNPFSQVRVTTIEQTLIDCLHRPFSAGGPAIVFEVWENGFGRVKPAAIIALAKAIGDPILMRRVGFMLEQHLSGDRNLLDELRAPLPEMIGVPSLLPGLPYQHINIDWNLRTP